MSQLDLLLRAQRTVTAAGDVARCVGVADERIVAIEPYESTLTAERGVGLDDAVVLLMASHDSGA